MEDFKGILLEGRGARRTSGDIMFRLRGELTIPPRFVELRREVCGPRENFEHRNANPRTNLS